MANNSNSVLAIYSSYLNADDAFKTFHKAYFNRKRLSTIHKNSPVEAGITSRHRIGSHISSWGQFGAFYGLIWGAVFGIGFFIIPGVKPIMSGGLIVSWLVSALGAAAVLGSLSAFGAALASFVSASIKQYAHIKTVLLTTVHKELAVGTAAARAAV